MALSREDLVSRLKRSDSGLRLKTLSWQLGGKRGVWVWGQRSERRGRLWQRGVKRGQTPSAVNHQLWFMSGHTQTISSASPLDSSKGNRGLLCLYMLELEEAVMLNRRWVVCGSHWSNAIAEFLLFADVWLLVFSCSVTFYIWFVLGWCFNQWFVDRSLMKTWQDFSGNVSFFHFPPRVLMA